MRPAALRLAVPVLAPLALVGATAVPADAAKLVCKKRSELIDVLARKFGETQQSFGLQNDTRVLEVYASEKGSWTAILTLPDGKSCVVASGQAWTTLPAAQAGEPV